MNSGDVIGGAGDVGDANFVQNPVIVMMDTSVRTTMAEFQCRCVSIQ